MRLVALFALLGFAAGIAVEVDNNSTSAGNVISNRYIVEFDNTAHLSGGISHRGLSAHEHFYEQLRSRDVAFDVMAEYKTEKIFVGASVEINTAEDLDKLSSAAGVLNVWPVRKYSLPPAPQNNNTAVAASSSLTSRASTSTNATAPARDGGGGYRGSAGNGNSTLSIVQNTTQVSPMGTADGSYGIYSQLPAIGADKVHKQGNLGAGIKVGVIDTGVDYTHPALGGCFGDGCKVRKGYDFVGDNYPNSRVEDSDPMDCLGHGTMVAGLIAANDNDYNAPGVAPQALIYAYKVFGCIDTTNDQILISAMLRAQSDGVDVINMSVGTTAGWTFSPSSIVAGRLSNAGIQTVVSAGNSGANGMFYPDSPAAGRGVLSAGSIDPAGTINTVATVNTGSGTFNVPYPNAYSIYLSDTPLKVYATDQTICDAANTPANFPSDLTGYVAIVKRGGCTFDLKAKAVLQNKGAVILIWNNDNTYFVPGGVTTNIPYSMIGYNDGLTLFNQYNQAKSAGTADSLTMTFGVNPIFNPYSTAGQLSDFSSLGPTYDLFPTPHLLAPGRGIFGLATMKQGGWAAQSGTSFSAPLTAGSAALWIAAKRSANQTYSTQMLRDALQSSAANVAHTSKSESVAFVGGGMLNVYNAIYAGTRISPTQLLLNDTEYFAGTKYLLITNTDTKTNSYQLAHQPAALVYGMAAGKKVMADKSNMVYDESDGSAAGVKFSRTSFSLNAGASTIVLLQFTAPNGANPSQLPVYSGYITITGGPVPLRVGYMGVATKMRDLPTVDTSGTTYGTHSPAMTIGSSWTESPDGQKYDFSNPSTSNSSSYPKIAWKALTASNFVSIDVVNENANLGINVTYSTYPTRRSLPIERNQDNETDATARGLESHLDSSLSRRSFAHHRSGRLGSVRPRVRRSGPAAESEAHVSELVARAGDDTAVLSAALKLWCLLTNNKGQGCTAASTVQKENTFDKVPIVGNYFSGGDWSRNDNNAEGRHANDVNYVWLNGRTLSNGQTLANGRYRILLRILKVNGDATQQSDYESWLSQVFEVAA